MGEFAVSIDSAGLVTSKSN